jgi:hypothetical protein
MEQPCIFRRSVRVAWFVWLIYIFFLYSSVCINMFYVDAGLRFERDCQSLRFFFTVYPVKLGTVVVAVDGVFVVPIPYTDKI